MTTSKPVLPPPQMTQPRVLRVEWNSGHEEIDLDAVEAARKAGAAPWTTVMTTHEQRKGTNRIAIYNPTLEVHSNGFALRYNEQGCYADDDEMLQNAEGELGRAVYLQDDAGKWSCSWFGDDEPETAHNFDCEELGQGHDWRQVDVRVRNAWFRKNVLAAGSGCIVTGEDNQDVLDAAHIDEANGEGNDSVFNGLVMRKDIHWLFDKGIIKIDSNGKVTMKPILDSYKHLFKDKAPTTWKNEPTIDHLEKRLTYINLRNNKKAAKKKGEATW